MSSSDEEPVRPLSEHEPLSEGFEMKFSALRGERGVQGDKGDKGDEGKVGPRLPKRQARAVVYLFIVAAVVGIAALAGLLHDIGFIVNMLFFPEQFRQTLQRATREKIALGTLEQGLMAALRGLAQSDVSVPSGKTTLAPAGDTP